MPASKISCPHPRPPPATGSNLCPCPLSAGKACPWACPYTQQIPLLGGTRFIGRHQEQVNFPLKLHRKTMADCGAETMDCTAETTSGLEAREWGLERRRRPGSRMQRVGSRTLRSRPAVSGDGVLDLERCAPRAEQPRLSEWRWRRGARSLRAGRPESQAHEARRRLCGVAGVRGGSDGGWWWSGRIRNLDEKTLASDFIYLLDSGPTCQCGFGGFAGTGMIFSYL